MADAHVLHHARLRRAQHVNTVILRLGALLKRHPGCARQKGSQQQEGQFHPCSAKESDSGLGSFLTFPHHAVNSQSCNFQKIWIRLE
jgi:hypothetical protein